MSMKELAKCLSYDPKTGEFKWMYHPCKKKHFLIGKKAGSISNGKYRRISFKGKTYQASHVAYMIKLGKHVPKDKEIDHINRVSFDDRWDNLRLVDPSENMKNRSTWGVSNIKGIAWCNSKRRWRVRATGDRNNRIHLGYFKNYEDAMLSRQKWNENECLER